MREDGKGLLFLDPVCKHNIWGGVKLREEFGYPVEGNDIGECWGISAHPEGDGTIRSGEYQGKKLSELWAKHPELFGNPPFSGVLPLKSIPPASGSNPPVQPPPVLPR